MFLEMETGDWKSVRLEKGVVDDQAVIDQVIAAFRGMQRVGINDEDITGAERVFCIVTANVTGSGEVDENLNVLMPVRIARDIGSCTCVCVKDKGEQVVFHDMRFIIGGIVIQARHSISSDRARLC